MSLNTDLEQSSTNGRLDVRGARRNQIIYAVRKIVAEEGIASVTIARIAEVLGVSRGVVNYHFENKDAILHEALQSAIRDAFKSLNTGTGLLGLIEQVSALASTNSDWWPIYVAYLAEGRSTAFYRNEIKVADRQYRRALREMVGSEERAAAVLALMKGLALQKLVDDELDLQAAVEQMRELIESWSVS